MDMDRKGCTLEKVASLVLVRVREGPSCPFLPCLSYLLYFLLFPFGDYLPSNSMASYLILFHLLLSWTFHPDFLLLQLQREEEILAQLILGMSHYWLSGKWRAIIPRIGNPHLIIPGKWERLVRSGGSWCYSPCSRMAFVQSDALA